MVLIVYGGGSGNFNALVFNILAVLVEKRRQKTKAECGEDKARILDGVRREVREELRWDYLVTGSWSLRVA